MPMSIHDLGALSALVFATLARIYHTIMGLFSTPLSLAPAARPQLQPPPLDPGDKFPGMVNLSGTLCYMNSVLQAFASLPTLLDHLKTIIRLAVEVDIPTPVTDALEDVLRQLNTGHARPPPALRPHVLLAALSPLPQIRRLMGTREQQDAHELFVVLAEAVSDEALKVAKEVARARGGLGQALDLPLSDDRYARSRASSHPLSPSPSPTPSLSLSTKSPWTIPPPREAVVQPWEGLLARRRVCARCGYSDVVRVDTLGGMELLVPRAGDVTLDACISEYLSPERLSDVTCNMCSARATAAKYAAKALSLESKKNAAVAGKMAARLKSAIDAGVPPEAGGSSPANVKWETVRTDCLRETAITRAPRTLRFHFVRSEYTPYGQLLKKTARVAFPLMFDLGAHMARGVWEPRRGGGGVAAALASQTNGDNGGGPPPRQLYRLQSAILHYGYTHSSGHFVAIRRKPGAPLGVPRRGWLRISDADVDEVGAEELVESAGAVFMLFYERVDLPQRARETARGENEEARGERGETGRGESIQSEETEREGVVEANGFVQAPDSIPSLLGTASASFASLGAPGR